MNKLNKIVNISVAGSAGRMGKMLVSAVHSHPECSLVSATCHPSESDVIGKDAGLVSGLDYINVPISSNPQELLKADVIIDFPKKTGVFNFLNTYGDPFFSIRAIKQ